MEGREEMKLLIVGTWHTHKAAACATEAEEIGKILAARKHTLLSGGGTGIAVLVAHAYKKNKGRKHIVYLPDKKEMKRVGEKQEAPADEVIQTDLDYPSRNILMVKQCDGIIALHGGLGTLTEVIHAVKDYDKKVAVIDKEAFATWIKAIPDLREKVFLTPDVKKAVEYLEH